MDFYGITEKLEFQELIKQAKKTCVNEALKKLKEFEPMNETFVAAAMPEDTPKPVIKKRVNKLLLKKQEKELKRLLG